METAKSIQRSLVRSLTWSYRTVVVTNVYLLGSPWEADVVSVSPAFHWTEYEIKVSVADYHADFRKLSNKYSTGVLKHENYAAKTPMTHRRYGSNLVLPKPARFFFVTPPGLLADILLPEHVGLLEVDGGRVKQIKAAPRLKPAVPLSPKVLYNLAKKATHALHTRQST